MPVGKLPEGYPRALQICAMEDSHCVIHAKSGDRYTLFDVASLTKILVTVPLVMHLYDRGRIQLHAPVEKYLPFLKGTHVGRILIHDLLCHHSGLEWWRPYFKTLEKVPAESRVGLLKNIFRTERVKAQGKAIYSDLDFILLGWVVEDLFDLSLDEAASLHLFRPLELSQTFFNPKQHLKKIKECAPTEKTKDRGLIQGEVHDDNAFALNGVAGHAGLFSTLEDVEMIGSAFLATLQGKTSSLWKPSTMKLFTKRTVPVNVGDWGLGFTLPSRPTSAGGTKISSHAFGHTGFTGTSLWIDPSRKAVVVILSNRTFPSRQDTRFQQLRPKLHDEIWEMIDAK